MLAACKKADKVAKKADHPFQVTISAYSLNTPFVVHYAPSDRKGEFTDTSANQNYTRTVTQDSTSGVTIQATASNLTAHPTDSMMIRITKADTVLTKSWQWHNAVSSVSVQIKIK